MDFEVERIYFNCRIGESSSIFSMPFELMLHALDLPQIRHLLVKIISRCPSSQPSQSCAKFTSNIFRSCEVCELSLLRAFPDFRGRFRRQNVFQIREEERSDFDADFDDAAAVGLDKEEGSEEDREEINEEGYDVQDADDDSADADDHNSVDDSDDNDVLVIIM